MGIAILALDVIWILFYYYYATVKVYNLYEKEKYQYLGHLWIRKKRGEYYLFIPEEMINNSITTKYKIVSSSVFHQVRKGKKICINFAGKYDVQATVSARFTVKNYIATSHRL